MTVYLLSALVQNCTVMDAISDGIPDVPISFKWKGYTIAGSTWSGPGCAGTLIFCRISLRENII